MATLASQDTDAAAPLGVPAARGRRPEFTDDPMLDRLYSITLALVTELAVTRTRLDTVERLLARRSLLADTDIDAFRAADAAEAAARSQLQAEYLQRVFREFESATRSDPPR